MILSSQHLIKNYFICEGQEVDIVTLDVVDYGGLLHIW